MKEDSGNFVIKPLGILISLPVLEVLRQQYGLAFGTTIIDHRSPQQAMDSQYHAICFAFVCISLLFILTIFE